MRKILASLLASVGLASEAQPGPKVQTIDPNTILFSMPTLSDDLASLEPITRNPSSTDLVFHEDEWSQVEFLTKDRLPEIQRLLKDYKAFEQAHRTQYGWRKVYVRKLERRPILSGNQPIQQLERLLGARAGEAPMLFSSSTISGRVKDGFSLPLGGNVSLYGYVSGGAIPVLGANVGKNPDDFKLTQVFMKLNGSNGLVLVDWRGQFVLVGVSKSGEIEVWRP